MPTPLVSERQSLRSAVRPSIAEATTDVVVSLRRTITAVMHDELSRAEYRLQKAWRRAALLIPMIVAAIGALAYVLAGVDSALIAEANWPAWQSRLVIGLVLAVFASIGIATLTRTNPRPERHPT